MIYIITGARNIYNSDYRDFEVKHLHYSDIDTGDILLVGYDSYPTMFNRSLICLKFVHSAICVKEDGKLYIYEFNNYFNEKIGFLRLTFSEWFKYNKNSLLFFNKLNIKNDSKEKRKELASKFMSFRKQNTFENNWNFLDYLGRYLFPNEKYEEFDKTKTHYACFELVLHMLRDSDIIGPIQATEQYVTDDLIGMKKFDMKEGYDYDDYHIADVTSLKLFGD